MQHINVDALIKRLRQHCARLHEMYVDERDFGLCDRLLQQITNVESIIAELQTIV